MVLMRSVIVLFVGAGLIACPSFSGMPESSTRVLGFATNCNKGATALLTHYGRQSDDHEDAMTVDAASLKEGDSEVTIGEHWRDSGASFAVNIDQITKCVFQSSTPALVFEANCYKHDAALPTCKARINFQGHRPAPEGYETMAYPPHYAQGAYPATPPENLFDEPDLIEANNRERKRLGNAIDFTTAFFDHCNQAQDAKAKQQTQDADGEDCAQEVEGEHGAQDIDKHDAGQ